MPASRTDPALVEAASQLRAAIRAAVANQTGWATLDEIAGRIDLPATVVTLHRSLLAGVELAYITREIAADHPGLVPSNHCQSRRADKGPGRPVTDPLGRVPRFRAAPRPRRRKLGV
jgi:hypothetical protein